METERLRIILHRAPDDPPERDREFQSELSALRREFSEQGMPLWQAGFTQDSFDQTSYPVAAFSLALAGIFVPQAAKLLAVWLNKRLGRSISIQVAEDGAVAVNVERPQDLEPALEAAKKLRRPSEPHGKK